MQQKNIEKIGALIQRWGIPMQLIIATEEAAEIQKIYCKLLRGYGLPREVLIDALADNYVMLQTVVQMYGFTSDDIEKVVNAKLERAMQVPVNPPQNQEPQASELPKADVAASAKTAEPAKKEAKDTTEKPAE